MQIFAETFSWNATNLDNNLKCRDRDNTVQYWNLRVILNCSNLLQEKKKERKIPNLWNKNLVLWTFGLHLCTSEKNATSFLSCSSVSCCPISWSSGLIPASPSLWPLFPRCNCLRVWWTCVSVEDNLSRQLVIKAKSPFHPWPPSQTTFSHLWWRQHPQVINKVA